MWSEFNEFALQTVVEFFVVAVAIFLVVRQVNRWRRAPQPK